jgi:hypothetical protein
VCGWVNGRLESAGMHGDPEVGDGCLDLDCVTKRPRDCLAGGRVTAISGARRRRDDDTRHHHNDRCGSHVRATVKVVALCWRGLSWATWTSGSHR